MTIAGDTVVPVQTNLFKGTSFKYQVFTVQLPGDPVVAGFCMRMLIMISLPTAGATAANHLGKFVINILLPVITQSKLTLSISRVDPVIKSFRHADSM